VIILRACADIQELDFIEMLCADVTLDRKITTADATLLLKVLITDNDYLDWFWDFGYESVAWYDCYNIGNITKDRTANVWISEFTCPMVEMPDGRVARGEVYVAEFEMGKTYEITAEGNDISLNVWIANNTDGLQYMHISNGDGGIITFRCDKTDVYFVAVTTFEADRGVATLSCRTVTATPTLIIVTDK
jgi:hypothetical protein